MNLDELSSPGVLENLSDQQKRALAWEIIDQLAPAKGFSRKKLVPLHGAILSVLRGPGPREEVIGKIRKVLAEA